MHRPLRNRTGDHVYAEILRSAQEQRDAGE